MVRATYLSLIVIWSTTPLVIYWSSQSGVLFGLTARMVIGMFTLVMIFIATKQKLTCTKDAFITYLIAGLGFYLAMSLVYWSVQYIPSGWVSVIFGLSPIITGVGSIYLLNENHFTISKTLGMVLGMTGLLVIFSSSKELGTQAIWGVCAMMMSTIAHSMSAIFIKKINASVSGVESTFGGLLIAVPLFSMTFLMSGGSVDHISMSTVLSIGYLGIIATAVGFSMYYFILKKMDVVRVSLISLVTPVCALFLGSLLNGEKVTVSVLVGTALIITGLALFEIKIKYRCKALKQRVDYSIDQRNNKSKSD